MSYKMPEITGPKSGCFSKIPRHPPEIKNGYLNRLIKMIFYQNLKNQNLNQQQEKF